MITDGLTVFQHIRNIAGRCVSHVVIESLILTSATEWGNKVLMGSLVKVNRK